MTTEISFCINLKKKNHFIFLLRKLANDPLPFELLIGNNGLHI